MKLATEQEVLSDLRYNLEAACPPRRAVGTKRSRTASATRGPPRRAFGHVAPRHQQRGKRSDRARKVL